MTNLHAYYPVAIRNANGSLTVHAEFHASREQAEAFMQAQGFNVEPGLRVEWVIKLRGNQLRKGDILDFTDPTTGYSLMVDTITPVEYGELFFGSRAPSRFLFTFDGVECRMLINADKHYTVISRGPW